MMIKAFRFRIYPNKKQEVKMISTLTTCRHLYNDGLGERRDQGRFNKLIADWQLFPWGKPEWINYYDQAKELKIYKDDYQKEVHSQVLQNVLKRLEKSYKSFFNGEGYPRFQGRNRYDSFTFPQSGFEIVDGKLKLSKIGLIRMVQHREIEGVIKTCTIKRDVDQWYVSFSCIVEPESMEYNDRIVGIDVGLKSIITTSDNIQIDPPQHLRESEEKLTKAQRELSRKKKKSLNRNKARIDVAKIHRKIRNQRKDFNHKVSRSLVNEYGIIVFEKLQIRNMVKNHHLAKSISDASWYQLIQFTSYKAEWAGRIVEQVNPRNTSKTCSVCGHIQDMPLSQRIFICENCPNIMDRDLNASINIKSRAVGTTVQACGGHLVGEPMSQEAPLLVRG